MFVGINLFASSQLQRSLGTLFLDDHCSPTNLKVALHLKLGMAIFAARDGIFGAVWSTEKNVTGERYCLRCQKVPSKESG